MVPDHQVRRKWSGDASKRVQLFKVGGSRIIGTAVSLSKTSRQKSMLRLSRIKGAGTLALGSQIDENIRPRVINQGQQLANL